MQVPSPTLLLHSVVNSQVYNLKLGPLRLTFEVSSVSQLSASVRTWLGVPSMRLNE